MFSRNSLELTGNFVKILKDTCNDKGERLVRFTLAYNTLQKGEKEPMYLDCVAYGLPAEILLKENVPGREFRCNGELLPNNYVDKTGKKQYKFQYKVKYIESGSLPKKYASNSERQDDDYLDKGEYMYIGNQKYVRDDYIVDF